ncbi:MAG: NAD(P)H-hydrate dehydratase [Bacteroidaceae bacterium]|nr:NAD(P)H-hydrate dehydratase [Bacteroidaceae bacterium]
MDRKLVENRRESLLRKVSRERVFTDETASVEALIRPRDPQAHKNTFGHALLYAGSTGMAGAAVLSARACLRSGAGLLTVCTPACNNMILQISVPEAMTVTPDRILPPEGCMERFSAIGAGPGLGTAAETAITLRDMLKSVNRPMVLDADALNIIASDGSLTELVPKGSVMTPHPGELSRLTGSSDDMTGYLMKASELASRHGITVVVKGAPTVTAAPDGTFYINTTGNSGMATAGSGDVLTGIVLALLAQGYNGTEAARIAVYIHGLAGDMAARELSRTAMTSADIASHLAGAWLIMEK